MVDFFPNAKTFLQVGPFSIQWYAICILAGASLVYWLSKRNIRSFHYPADYLSDFFVGCLWVGILGARIWYCLFYDLSYFLEQPLRIFEIYNGGLAIHGGVMAGLVYAYFFCKKRHISFLRFGDAILPNVLSGQAIGRWGNFINQEAFGQEVSESFFQGSLSFLKEGMHIQGKYYEPTFFYESVANVIGFLLIHWVLKKKQNKRGDLVWAYIMWYGVVRFFVEARRSDALMIGSFRIAQIISLLGLVIGILGYIGVWERFFPKEKASVLFDLDGTLVNTEKTILESYRHVFRQRGREAEFTREKELAVLGPSLQEKLHEFFPEEDVQELIREYRAYHDGILRETAHLMPHVEEMLQQLSAEGYSLGIVTARLHDSAENVLRCFGLSSYFCTLVGKDEVHKGKPDIEGMLLALTRGKMNRDEVVYIGDSVNDVLFGKNYGAFSVGYYFNEERREVLTAAKADEYVEDYRELPALLQEYFSKNRL